MQMTNGQRKQWAEIGLAEARESGAGQEVIDFFQAIIDDCNAKAFAWLGRGN